MRLDGAVRAKKKKKTSLRTPETAFLLNLARASYHPVFELRGTPPSGDGCIQARMIVIDCVTCPLSFLREHVRLGVPSSGVFRPVPRLETNPPRRWQVRYLVVSNVYGTIHMCEPPKEPGPCLPRQQWRNPRHDLSLYASWETYPLALMMNRRQFTL